MSARKKPKPTKQAVAKAVTDVDRAVSANIVELLDGLGKSRKWLAERLGLNESSVDKYCTGRARITASRLHEIATALGVKVDRLFHGAGHGFN